MNDFAFKTYIHDGQEYFIFGEKNAVDKGDIEPKVFPFPQSFLLMLSLNPVEIEKITNPLWKKFDQFYQTPTSKLEKEIMAALDELAQMHIYFELLKLDWERRFAKAKASHYENVLDDLPRKEITHIYSNFQVMQQQIATLFHEVLYFEDDRDEIPDRMIAYYEKELPDDSDRYELKPYPVSYELVKQGEFTDVLYPKTIYDLIGFALRECVKRKIRMRVCESCGRWFAMTGRSTAIYCNLPRNGKVTGCRGLAAVKKWTDKRNAESPAFREYRREYKRRFAWIKSGRITAEQFYAWSEQARMREDHCEKGEMTFEEFVDWLKWE